ncbi:YczE/YyaS/YitT family protein [Anaerofustis butyriciformans]|uniref:YczE/YyaS/YitT family protein n=1 Tax=Anaerofustis butyriciformans TaxID=3108533 RepID=UPI002E3449B9|nr:DUF6198 family protein [Anaerofustis sp. HA2171]
MAKESLFKRYLVFIIGVIINSFGIAFITKAALGTSPISSLPCVLSLKFTPTLGEFTFIMNMLFIIIQIILLRKNFQIIQLLQIVVNIVFSLFIDISMNMLYFLNPQTFITKGIFLILGCAILAFGITLEVLPKVIMVPGEGIVSAISTVTKKEFGTIKVIFDVTLMSSATILSFLFFRGMNGIGIGTIISAVLVGLIVKFYHRYLPFLNNIFPSLN